MAARAGVEPSTLRLKAIDSTNAPPRPANTLFNTGGPYAHRGFERWLDQGTGMSTAVQQLDNVLLDKKLLVGMTDDCGFKLWTTHRPKSNILSVSRDASS